MQLHVSLQSFAITHDFLLTIITLVGGSNGVSKGPLRHWLPSLTTAIPFKSQKILFKAKSLGFYLLQP